MHCVVSGVVDMVGNNKVADAIALAEVEVVRIVATAEVTPRRYFVVAIVAVDSADMGLVVVALFVPLST